MEHILAHWNSQAELHSTGAAASWGDEWAVSLEVNEIKSVLLDLPQPPSRVLDVGCSNAHATIRIAHSFPETDFYGVDYSPQMISAAKTACSQAGTIIDLVEADARELPFPSNYFDMSFTTRTLINLPTWTDQAEAIRELIRVTRPGGIVAISEAFWEPLCKLNAFRDLLGLPPLREHDFNRYIKREVLENFLFNIGLKNEWIGFSSIYYLGSRGLREVCTDAPSFPGYSNPLNQAFFSLENDFSGGPFSVQALVKIRIDDADDPHAAPRM